MSAADEPIVVETRDVSLRVSISPLLARCLRAAQNTRNALAEDDRRKLEEYARDVDRSIMQSGSIECDPRVARLVIEAAARDEDGPAVLFPPHGAAT